MYSLTKKAIAEGIGTLVLVFFACGTAIVTNGSVVATALAFGLVIVAMAYSIGNISGCHINPAVSLGMLIAKKMSVVDFCAYVIAQVIGAIVGAALLFGVLKLIDYPAMIWAVNTAYCVGGLNFGGIFGSLIFEVVLTFVFVFTILGVTSKTENGKISGIVIGLALTLVHLIGINVTGTSVNPARSFGPALMNWIFNGDTAGMVDLWLFIVAPLAGGALAAFVFGLLNKSAKKDDELTGEEVK